MTMEQKNAPFYLSRKFWLEIVAAGVFLTLALTQTVVFSSQEVMIFVLGLAGIAVGGHALTDVGAMIAGALTARRAAAPEAEEEEPEIVTVNLTPEPEEEEEEEKDDA
jgi:hypothetical protein